MKNINESEDQTSNISIKINQSFSLIGKLFSRLTPRNEEETKIIQTIVQNLRVVKSGISQILNLSKTIEPENLIAPKEKPKTTSDISMQSEMSSAAAGGITGTAGKKKKILDEEEEIKEAKINFRKLIKESIYQLYEQNPSFLDEESFPMETSSEEAYDPTNSTGAKILNDVFGNVRQAIDKALDRLTTNQQQRESFKRNFLAMMSGEFSKLETEKPSQVIGSENGQTKVSKEDLKKYMVPESEATGFAQASDVMISIWTSVKDAYSGLGDPRDKKVFSEGMLENSQLMCDEKEKEISSKQNEMQGNNQQLQNQNSSISPQDNAGQQDDSLKSLLNPS